MSSEKIPTVPDRLPYPYPSNEKVRVMAINMRQESTIPDYSIKDAEQDAFAILNIGNALDSRFIEGPIDYIGPMGRTCMTLYADPEEDFYN